MRGALRCVPALRLSGRNGYKISDERDVAMEPTDIRQLMAGMRFEPKTRRQWELAEAGAAECDRDYPGGNVRYGDALIGSDKYWRAGYELRYHELLALYPPGRGR